MTRKSAGIVIFVTVLQCGCSLFPTHSNVHKVPEAVNGFSSETRNSSERATTSSSPAMDRLMEIEQFLQTTGSRSSANHERKQTPPGRTATLSMEQLREIEQHFQKPNTQLRAISELKPGQHVCLLTHSAVSRTPNAVRHSIDRIAGTIVSVDENVLVLKNTVKLTEGRTMTATPRFNKIPYLSRLFKNSGVGRESIMIPGEVSIARSEIQGIDELTSEDIAALQLSSDSARIGIDFGVSSNQQ